jgi:TIR domain
VLPRVARDRIRFDFVGFGESARDVLEGSDHVWLDVGNELRVGVVDQHHLAAYLRSTTSLVVAHGDLVRRAVNPDRRDDAPFTIVMHEQPDLDAVAATCLSIALLTTGELPSAAPALARYMDDIDQGLLGLSIDSPFSMYAAYAVIAHRFAQRAWRAPIDRWRKTVEEGVELVDSVLEALAQGEQGILDIDAFRCPGLFGPSDRQIVDEDIERYRKKLSEPRTCARKLALRLPGQLGGTREVPALLVRDVQGASDPDRVIFFKDWARSDRDVSPEHQGFVGLSMFQSESDAGPRRCILSVRPDSRTSLRGLGEALDRAESEARTRAYGVDDRVEDPRTHETKVPRPGYQNADPWYDGRAHAYTIIDAPRSGTQLTADEIEQIFIDFGQRHVSDASSLDLLTPGDISETPSVNVEGLRRLTTAVETLRRSTTAPPGPREPPAVFISYPRTRLEWTRKNAYEPLRRRFGDRVFFDVHSLEVGMDWLNELADAVHDCQVFLAVYCDDYFRSSFCQWELQLAVIRDPLATQKILAPVSIEPVTLPPYCAHIQAHSVTRGSASSEIPRIVEEMLRGRGAEV